LQEIAQLLAIETIHSKHLWFFELPWPL